MTVASLTASLSRPKRLLLVDDDQPFCELFASTCDRFIVDVSMAHNREQALSQINSGPCDLVFVDVNLGPGPDGVDLFREIRHALPRQPVCFLSGHLDSNVLDRIGAIGFAPVIRKPTDLEHGRIFEDMLRTFGVQLKQTPK
jgi:DNA-binding response OmpR family regulator